MAVPHEDPSKPELSAAAVRALLSLQASLSLHTMILGYLVLASCTTIVGAGVLLYQQLQLILEGQSYIESIQSGLATRNARKGLLRSLLSRSAEDRLRKVFGSEPALLWLRPRVGHPPGSSAEALMYKCHQT